MFVLIIVWGISICSFNYLIMVDYKGVKFLLSGVLKIFLIKFVKLFFYIEIVIKM